VLRAWPHDSMNLVPSHIDRQRAFFSGWRSGKGDKPDDDESGGASSSTKATKPAEPEAAKEEPTTAPAQQQEGPAQTSEAAKDSLVPVAQSTDNLSQDTEAPLEPELVAFPLKDRPLIPGHRQLLVLQDQKVIKELMKMVDRRIPRSLAVFLQNNNGEEPPMEPDQQAMPPAPADLGDRDPMEALHHVGTRASIISLAPYSLQNEDGKQVDGMQVIIQGRELINLEKVLSTGPPLRIQASLISKKATAVPPLHEDTYKAWVNEILQTIRELTRINPQFREHASFINHTTSFHSINRSNAAQLSHMAISLTSAKGSDQQRVLAEVDHEKKLQGALELLKQELAMSKIQQKIATQIEEKVSTSHREYLLREQLKMIKKELGEDKSDGGDKLLQKFKERLEAKIIPKEAREAIDSELEKFTNLAKESQEYQITRNYLDWLTQLPWGVHSKDTLSLQKAKEILDKDHYGLEDVKQRILELIAVGSLRGSVQGKIVCLVGPPGVGKTSIGKSIAQALGREFYRFSVGGLYDVAEIKGHRRTYVGAMPGKIIQCLKKVQTANPLVLIDEVDKIGRGHQGDPASALLELLDPSQNSNFLDHYLDVPVDCSKVLFVCTANVLDTIPGPLLDRMEVIRLSGYDMREKLKIAEDYLVPTAMREVGLWPQLPKPEAEEADAKVATDEQPAADSALPVDSVTVSSEAEVQKAEAAIPEEEALPSPPETRATITEGAIESLIRWYCREAGVRNLQKHIEKICRKLSTQYVERREALEQKEKEAEAAESKDAAEPAAAEEDTSYLHVTADRLADLVGKQKFLSDRLYEGTLPPGTVTGLAWTSMGGSVLYIEAAALPRPGEAKGSPVINITGQLGSVMKESSQIALLVVRRQLTRFPERSKFFEENELHVHCPEGATPKDGPSAGVTMVTSLFSLAMDTSVRPDLAMTGEVSLNGKVLAIGGVKEKTIAARRAGCKVLVFPETNRRDFDELPEYVKEGLEVHFATEITDVLKVAFPNLPA